MVFYPSAAFSNAPKFDHKVYDKYLSFFYNNGDDNENQPHFQTSKHSKELNHTI